MDDELEGAAPNCPHCLRPLEPTGRVEAPHWSCDWCGLALVDA
jgi:ribosomal protein L37AE/L43A